MSTALGVAIVGAFGVTAASVGAGLLFLVTDGLLNALGEGAALSPVLAAWTAPLVFAALATTVLLRMEG